MKSRSAFAPPHGAATAEEDDVRIEVAAEDAEGFAIGDHAKPPRLSSAAFSLRDILSRGVRARMGRMTSL